MTTPCPFRSIWATDIKWKIENACHDREQFSAKEDLSAASPKMEPWEGHWAAIRVAIGEFSTNSSPPGHSWRELPRTRSSITDTLPIPDSNPHPLCDEKTGGRGRHNNTIVFGQKTWAQRLTLLPHKQTLAHLALNLSHRCMPPPC